MQRHHKDKLYFQIGLHVASKHPDLAKEIIDKYLHTEALDDRLENISAYRDLYSAFLQNAPKPKSIFDANKLFTSAMLRIFTPGVYNQQSKKLDFSKYGFSRALGASMGLKDSWTSQLLRKAIVHEKIYEEYRAEVAELVNFLTSNLKATAC